MAANSARSGPLVPVRQLTLCQTASASMVSAEIDSISGTESAAGDPRRRGNTSATSDGVDLLVASDRPRPTEPTRAQPLAEGGADAIAGIRQHGAEAHAGSQQAIDLGKRDLGLGAVALADLRHTGPAQPRGIAGPTLRQEQPQADGTGTSSWASVSETRVWQFAFLPSAEAYCGATPTECWPFFGRAVSSMTSTASGPPTSRSAWASEFVLERTGIPDPARYEMMQLVVIGRRQPLGHRLHALALARPDQARNIKRAHRADVPGGPTAPGTAQASPKDRPASPSAPSRSAHGSAKLSPKPLPTR